MPAWPASADKAIPGRTGRDVVSKRSLGMGVDVVVTPGDETGSGPLLAPATPFLAQAMWPGRWRRWREGERSERVGAALVI